MYHFLSTELPTHILKFYLKFLRFSQISKIVLKPHLYLDSKKALKNILKVYKKIRHRFLDVF